MNQQNGSNTEQTAPEEVPEVTDAPRQLEPDALSAEVRAVFDARVYAAHPRPAELLHLLEELAAVDHWVQVQSTRSFWMAFGGTMFAALSFLGAVFSLVFPEVADVVGWVGPAIGFSSFVVFLGVCACGWRGLYRCPGEGVPPEHTLRMLTRLYAGLIPRER